MRVFVVIRHQILTPPKNELHELQQEVKQLKEYIEEVFTDYNDINEDTRTQLDLINKTLAELQIQKRLSDKPRKPVGFVKPHSNRLEILFPHLLEQFLILIHQTLIEETG